MLLCWLDGVGLTRKYSFVCHMEHCFYGLREKNGKDIHTSNRLGRVLEVLLQE